MIKPEPKGPVKEFAQTQEAPVSAALVQKTYENGMPYPIRASGNQKS
jgi:hypothetical protein